MLGINPTTVNQVMQMGSKYSQDFNGLLKAVQENGGMAKVDEAMKYINNPMVKKGLNLIGLSTEEITNAYNKLKSTPMTSKNTSQNDFYKKGSNSYLDRLKSLK